ncbi:MAG TPA: cupredoxin family copper-binding protein [Allosphingosinicella sp.]|nr:cupredoxin family copper-binding protein [Allosphingosinicella sp.]
MTRPLFAALAGAFAFTFAAAPAPAQPAPAAVIVKIGNFTFGPQAITVAAGTTVTWINQDDIPHTVVSDDRTSFRSKVLDTGDRFSFTFARPGSFGYFCSIHPHMVGKVVVKPR